MILTWLGGLLRRRSARLAAAAFGVALAVALLASLGAFLASSKATMTARAARSAAVDWQVQVAQGANPAAVLDLVRGSSGVQRALPVGYAQISGLSATVAGSAQRTGPGVALGIPASYRQTFPSSIRSLVGAQNGVLVAQQTAANLHVAPGDMVRIGRTGLPAVTVRVSGVVDLPQANSLFQKVGAPIGSQPAAPPDNVVLLPQTLWQKDFRALAAARPDQVSTQIHVARTHQLPPDPAAAYTAVTAAAHNLEARSVGTAAVGNNLGAALDAARGDAAYSQVLFLFLGLPGAVLATLLTAAVVGAGGERRRRDQALLRSRGASARELGQVATVEATAIGIVGVLVGLLAAAIIGRVGYGSARFGATPASAVGWTVGAAVVGLLVTAATVLLPALRDRRRSTVAAGRQLIGRPKLPWPLRWGVDIVLLTVALVVFWVTSRNGYQIVLAPEGVPTISVSYWAFAGPALLWVGGGLLTWRLADLLLNRGRTLLARLLHPLAGNLAATVAAGMSRQRRTLASSIVLLALALSFAASTAVFNATYRQQAEADAQLTNGADVTVTVPTGSTMSTPTAAQLAAVPGVRAVEPLQHRFAYVGTDLQDLYGVRPASIRSASALQDAYFSGGTAAGLMAKLAAKPDSILVSAETVKDFQLKSGDLIRLRLQGSASKGLVTVPFHYAGIVSEFPTAPKDSFFVANQAYVAARTGSSAVGAFLLDTGGKGTTAVAQRVQTLLGASTTVTDIASTRGAVGSSLTSVDLAGLTRVELSFALLLAAASGGLVLALGLAERRRTFAIAAALGASPRQLRGFVSSEAAVLTILGLLAGAITGGVVSQMLVKVLTGVFDPPPSALAIPWAYLLATGVITMLALAAAAAGTVGVATRPGTAVLREL